MYDGEEIRKQYCSMSAESEICEASLKQQILGNGRREDKRFWTEW
jgi:hypothetical protein